MFKSKRPLCSLAAVLGLMAGMAHAQSWPSAGGAVGAGPTGSGATSLAAGSSPVALLGSTGSWAERVGRVAAITGAAQLWDAEERQWMPLLVNRMVTAGDRIRSEPHARVDVQIGTLGLWIGPQSDVEFARLDAQGAQVRLNQGHLVARVQTAEWARDLQLATGELVAHPLAPGLYRLDRDMVSGGRSAAAALRGLLSLQAVDARLQVAAGQRIEVMGAEAGGGLRSTVMLHDAYAGWVSARDQAAEAPTSAAAAPWREVTGLDTLERYGRWESHPEVGWIWYPVTVRPGWEPFRDGRWVWVRPWGWTWVDDAPWGFAPAHYGRWIQWNSRWVWSPGHGHSRPPPSAAPPVGTAPAVRPRDDGPLGEWRADHETRSVRTPRIEGSSTGVGRLSAPPLGAVPSPSGVLPMPGAAEDRPARPDRRHGLDRPSTDSRSEPTRTVKPTESRPQERERSEKRDPSDRQRQIAQ